MHSTLEGYLKTGEWTSGIPQFAIDRAVKMREYGYIPEVKLAFNDKWERVEWDDPTVWVRGIIDAMRPELPTIYMGEWKTGKPWEDHYLQRELYLVMALAAHPEAEESDIDTIYIDQGFVTADVLHRAQLDEKKEIWLKRVDPMLRDTFYSPRPGQHCNWCSFSNRKGGPCVY
jgi:hypothetical protein